MGNVATLVDTNVESMDAMGASVRELAKKTPVELGQLSSALYDVRSAGISAEDAMAVLESSAQLGVAGLATTAEAANIMTTAINSFAAEGLSAEQASDILFKTVKAGKTTLSELTNQFGSVAAAAAPVGVSFADVQAATAAMTTVGIQASTAQTQLKQALSEMQKPGKELSKIFQQLGVKDGIELIKTSGGLGNAFKLIKEQAEASGMTVAQVTGSLETQSAIIAVGSTANETYTTTLADMTTGANAVNVAFEKQAKTADAQFQLMQNAFQDIKIEIGQALVPTMIEATETLRDFANSVDFKAIFEGLQRSLEATLVPVKELAQSFADIFSAFDAGMPSAEKTEGIFTAINVAIRAANAPLRVVTKILSFLNTNVLAPLVETGVKVINWFNEVREGGGFVAAAFDKIAGAASTAASAVRGVGEFLGFVDSAEQKTANNKEKAEKAKQKAVEETKNKEKAAADAAAEAAAAAAEAAAAAAEAAKERAKKLKEIQAQFNKEMRSLADELTLMMIADENERAKKQLEIQKRNDLASIEASEFTAEQKAELKAKIDEKYNQLEIDRQKAQNEKIKKLEQEVIDFIQSAKDEQRQDELTAAKEDLAFANSIIEKSKTLSLKDVDEQEERFNKIAAAGLFSEQQLLLARQTFAKMREEVSNQEASKAQESIAKTQETFSQIAGAVTSVTGPAFSAINALYDANLQRLENEKNKRLANENLTAEERLRIEEEYEKKKNEMMAEQFEVGRAEQIITATMSAAQAALNAYASTAAIPLVGPGLATAAAAIAAGFGALQIGVIAAQPNPYKFYDGTPYLQLGDNPKGRDTIPVMAHEGEAIIPTRNNLQYPGLAKSWIEGDLDRYINNNFVRPALMEQQKQAEEEFADRLAASMALQMAANFDDYRLHRDLKEQTAVLRDGFHSMKTTRKKLRGA